MLNEADSVTPEWDPVKGVDRELSDKMTVQIFECNVALEAGYATLFTQVCAIFQLT